MVDPIFPGLLVTRVKRRLQTNILEKGCCRPCLGPPIPVVGRALGSSGLLAVTSFLSPSAPDTSWHLPHQGDNPAYSHNSLRCLLCARPCSPQAGGEGGKLQVQEVLRWRQILEELRKASQSPLYLLGPGVGSTRWPATGVSRKGGVSQAEVQRGAKNRRD